MQYSIYINQSKALEWGLNPKQAILFAFVYTLPSWANEVKQGSRVYYAISKAKIASELPLLTDKPDTVYRLLTQLKSKGLVDLSSTSQITLLSLTKKAKGWNVYPKNEVGKISDGGRINLRSGSDKSPTNHRTNNHNTSNHNSPLPPKGGDEAEAVPVKAIHDLYNEVCTRLPKSRGLTPKRRSQIQARWKEESERQNLDWWRAFFEYVNQSDFLANGSGGSSSWKGANLEWITNANNMVKIIEGQYENE